MFERLFPQYVVCMSGMRSMRYLYDAATSSQGPTGPSDIHFPLNCFHRKSFEKDCLSERDTHATLAASSGVKFLHHTDVTTMTRPLSSRSEQVWTELCNILEIYWRADNNWHLTKCYKYRQIYMCILYQCLICWYSTHLHINSRQQPSKSSSVGPCLLNSNPLSFPLSWQNFVRLWPDSSCPPPIVSPELCLPSSFPVIARLIWLWDKVLSLLLVEFS